MIILLSATMIVMSTVYFLFPNQKVVTKTKRVPVVKINYSVESVRDWMLRVGVSNAWVEEIKGTGIADCFATTMFSNRSALSYCELRQK